MEPLGPQMRGGLGFDAHIIPEGLPGAGSLLLFDNQGEGGYPAVTLRVLPGSRVLEIDPVKDRVVWEYSGTDNVHLGPTEFRLLKLLMHSPSRVFSREEILNRIWDTDCAVRLRTVDVHMRRLREAITREGEPDVVRTVRGAGYRLELE